MNKIIFLDCNGVIATPNSRFKLDKEKCDLIQKIIDATDAKIVISSWRLTFLVDTLKLFQFGLWIDGKPDHRFPFIPTWAYEIIGQTRKGFVSCYNNTQNTTVCSRGLEIQWWIDENINFKGFKYVILDDDSDMLLCQKDNFIKTNTHTGITEEQVKEAIKILNS